MLNTQPQSSADVGDAPLATTPAAQDEMDCALMLQAQEMVHVGTWVANLDPAKPNTYDVSWSNEMFRLVGHEPRSFTPTFDTFSYGPSKAAVHALTRQMAAHLVRRNILVNAIAPGPFPTWMLSTGIGTGGDVEGTDWEAIGRTMPRGRIGTPEDVAGLAIFLASRAGAFTVGDTITCDGGLVVGS